MRKLTINDLNYIGELLYERDDELQRGIEEMEGRDGFSENQKKILTKVNGKNYFKVENKIKKAWRERERLDRIYCKLKSQVYL